jgi:hypothetical protein
MNQTDRASAARKSSGKRKGRKRERQREDRVARRF